MYDSLQCFINDSRVGMESTFLLFAGDAKPVRAAVMSEISKLEIRKFALTDF